MKKSGYPSAKRLRRVGIAASPRFGVDSLEEHGIGRQL
jgi:hypothetical protein